MTVEVKEGEGKELGESPVFEFNTTGGEESVGEEKESAVEQEEEIVEGRVEGESGSGGICVPVILVYSSLTKKAMSFILSCVLFSLALNFFGGGLGGGGFLGDSSIGLSTKKKNQFWAKQKKKIDLCKVYLG